MNFENQPKERQAMKITLCVLNLTKAPKRLNVDHLLFADDTMRTDSPDKIPKSPEPLVLYIVGHAVPDTLLVPDGRPLREDVLVGKIKKRRGNNPTLIVWDLCFARSFEKIKEPGWAGKPYVHIFSCKEYEQSWHTGPTGDPQRQTLFSLAFQEAINEGFASWDDLDKKLTRKLGRLQRPSIVLPLAPGDFKLQPRAPENVIPLPAAKKKAAAGRKKKGAAGKPSHDRRPERKDRSAARGAGRGARQ
jgi:hypothetical protein